jgi:hypothetical protein
MVAQFILTTRGSFFFNMDYFRLTTILLLQLLNYQMHHKTLLGNQ